MESGFGGTKKQQAMPKSISRHRLRLNAKITQSHDSNRFFINDEEHENDPRVCGVKQNNSVSG